MTKAYVLIITLISLAPIAALIGCIVWDIFVEKKGVFYADPDEVDDDKKYYL